METRTNAKKKKKGGHFAEFLRKDTATMFIPIVFIAINNYALFNDFFT